MDSDPTFVEPPSQWDRFGRAEFEADAEALGFDVARNRLGLFSGEPWDEYRCRDTGMRWGGWIAAWERRSVHAAVRPKVA